MKYITQPEEVPTVLKGPGGDKWDMSYGDNVVLSYYKELGLIAPMTLDQVPGLAGLMPAFQTHPVEERRRHVQRGPMDLGVHGTHLRTSTTSRSRRAGTTSWIPKYQGSVSTVDGAMNNVALAPRSPSGSTPTR